MSRYPSRDEEARTGSNVGGEVLVARYREDADRLSEQHRELAREQHEALRKLFTKKDLRVAEQVAARVAKEWREASIGGGRDAPTIDELKRSARRKFERLVSREVPEYRKWLALRRTHVREHAKLTPAALAAAADVRGELGWDKAPPWLLAGQEFAPPFTVFDVQTIDHHGFIVDDDSFARPAIGHLVNDIVFDQDENTSFSDGLWGLLTFAIASNRVACGTSFTTPSEGRLQVSAELRNAYNKVLYSVHDKFGFSSADVTIFLQLFIAIVRGTKVIRMPTILQTTGLISHGSDLAFSSSDLDDTVPYTVSGTTTERFAANETVLVLAGSDVHIQTLIDDMHCKIDAVLWWELRKLTIGIAEDVFT